MYHIAVVEDLEFEQQNIVAHLKRYASEKGLEFDIRVFPDGEDFILRMPEHLDLVLMDIMMPKMDGMKAARLLRRQNDQVILIFVTSMIQYAVQGYSVDAMDFIVKPVSYTGLKVRLDRSFARLGRRKRKTLMIANADGMFPVEANEITYVETSNHKTIVHTKDRAIPSNQSMQALEKELEEFPFFRCHTAYLINLSYVSRVKGNDVWVENEMLAVSKYRRKDFMNAWSEFLGDEM